MAVEVGAKVSGKVSGITNFGAFVDLEDHKTGLVHISQVSNKFIKDIHDVLTVGDTVTVKVMSIGDDGKIALSIKAASDEPQQSHQGQHRGHFDRAAHNNGGHGSSNGGNHGGNNHDGGHHEGNNYHQSSRRPADNYRDRNNGNHKNGGHEDFDDLLSGFLKESESRLSTLRRNTEGKRGGRGGRRS